MMARSLHCDRLSLENGLLSNCNYSVHQKKKKNGIICQWVKFFLFLKSSHILFNINMEALLLKESVIARDYNDMELQTLLQMLYIYMLVIKFLLPLLVSF